MAGEIVSPSAFQGKEKIPTKVFSTQDEACVYAAHRIAEIIRSRLAEGRPAVLGFATGSTPVGVYRELIRMHREEGLSFKTVISFNLDEYYPMKESDPNSYHKFMSDKLFSHVDIDPTNIHIPDGSLPIEQVTEHCRLYDEAIRSCGGLDFQLLGIGHNGHIGFNEPNSDPESTTRLLYLTQSTRSAAASSFWGINNVPLRALTMGVSSILAAREVLLLAFTESKASIIAESVEGPVSPAVPASHLQKHPNVTFLLDLGSSSHLSRTVCPWFAARHASQLLSYDGRLERKAVIWLSFRARKPILKLVDEDYTLHSLQGLVDQRGPVYQINIRVYKSIQGTITGWPGGKPHHPIPHPAHTGDVVPVDVFPKTVLVFSPHPDDDVISMGGTFIRLCEQGHHVHVAYQTSGNNAVWDDDAKRFVWFAEQYAKEFGSIIGDDAVKAHRALSTRFAEAFSNTSSGTRPAADVLRVKALIRCSEARSAALFCGVKDPNIHFLEMPFYETGTSKKKPLSEADTTVIVSLLEHVQPHQIYAAGDMTDPNGTHRMCLTAIVRALNQLRTRGDAEWLEKCKLWLYRGAWQEWEPDRIEMAVPMSPQELMQKRLAIFKHQTQKDIAPFPGDDHREFWQRSEERNRETAKKFDQLGTQEYEAMEAFVSLDIHDVAMMHELGLE